MKPSMDEVHFLYICARMNFFEGIKQRLSEIEFEQEHLTKALVISSTEGHYDIVKYLLESLCVDLQSAGVEAFVMACGEGHFKIVQLFIEMGVNIRGMNDDGIYFAAEEGHSTIVKLLLDHGVPVNVRNGVLLDCACHYGNLDTVKVLVEHGIDIQHSEAYKNAQNLDRDEIVDYLRSKINHA